MTAASDGSKERFARPTNILICVCLAALVWIVFGQCLGHDFVEYDDQNYVYDNSAVTAGLTWRGLQLAFTQPHARNWHPLTTVSHMLDCQLFGLNPAGHHLTSIFLHAAASLLLFLFLRRTTAKVWLSAFVAALFAIHPLRVESVAWVAERKDALSAFFFMLTLHAYARYTFRPTWSRYAIVALSFALGLMSKPMLVTVPLVLLLLDYWPLRRLDGAKTFRTAVVEKLPLLALSLVSAAATLIAQKATVGYGERIPLLLRIGNAARACLTYIWQMFWPDDLAAFYPQSAFSYAAVTTAFALLLGLTAVALLLHKRSPYVTVGWFWYAVSLVPVLGLVPVGLQAHADRYTYLPQIGLYIAISWLVIDLAARTTVVRRLIVCAAPVVVLCLATLARSQAGTWRNTQTLWQHAVSVTSNNDLAHYNLASIAMRRGDVSGAIAHYEQALAGSESGESTSHVSAALLHNGLGIALALQGRQEEAATHYRKAIELRPDFADAHTNLASLLVGLGATDEAVAHYRAAVGIPPEDADSHLRFAAMLERLQRTEEAGSEYRRGLELQARAAAPQHQSVAGR